MLVVFPPKCVTDIKTIYSYKLAAPLSNAKTHPKVSTKLYCFWEARYFVWKIEKLKELQLSQSLIFFC